MVLNTSTSMLCIRSSSTSYKYSYTSSILKSQRGKVMITSLRKAERKIRESICIYLGKKKRWRNSFQRYEVSKNQLFFLLESQLFVYCEMPILPGSAWEPP